MLHTLRDRLTVDVAAKLAAQLPTLIRGIYYEDWDPSRTPYQSTTSRRSSITSPARDAWPERPRLRSR